MNLEAKKYIDLLSLSKHPEGGYFKEVYRSDEIIAGKCLPERFHGNRSFSTSIYFLLNDDEFSSFHKIDSDETWHFYDGSPVKIYMLNNDTPSEIVLGENAAFQYTIKKGTWFAAEIIKKDSFVLVGCTVAPGFDFADFELGDKSKLTSLFPKYGELIGKLTRD